MKAEINRNTSIIRDFNIPLSMTQGTNRHKISKDIANSPKYQHLIDIYRISYPIPLKNRIHTLLKVHSKHFPKTDHILSRITSQKFANLDTRYDSNHIELG